MIRIATFNCGNLFHRTALFSAPTLEAQQEVYADIQALRAELAKMHFDVAKIHALEARVRPYAHIETRRGRIAADGGAPEWAGDVVLDRAPGDDLAVRHTGDVIRAVDADIWCLQEIESRDTLRQFWEKHVVAPPGGARFPIFVCFDGNDPRGIDVALVSRFPVKELRSHVADWDEHAGRPIFSRDCLEAVVETPIGDLRLLVNHFRSRKGYEGEAPGADAKRRYVQAARVARIVELRGGSAASILVAGDLNQSPQPPDLAPLFTSHHLRDLKGHLAPKDRWTYGTEGNPDEIDHVLATPPIAQRLHGVRIERRWMAGYSGHVPGLTAATAASDHAPVVVELV